MWHLNGNPVFELRPDIVVSHEGQTAFIIDTKWKRLKEAAYREGVTSADVYQMFAYATQYTSPDVVLLYPHHAELGSWEPRRAEYWLKGAAESGDALSQRIRVSTIELRNLSEVPTQLAKIFAAPEPMIAG